MSKYIQTVDKITSNGKSTGWKMTISVPKSENIADVLRNITLNTQSLNSQIISVGSIQNELITGGNQSTSGSSSMQILYPAGNWMEKTTYTVNNYSTPFVYVKDNDKYYKCIQKNTAESGNKPGSGTNWKSYWEEITSYDAIYTENLLADNASFGDNNGAIIGSNYLYSQRGLDSMGNKVNYAEILTNNDKKIFNEVDITDPSGNSVKINTLNGNFTPSTYMDFYSGEVACNKFSEHFDYFYPFTITSDNKIMFNNTYRMDLNKSHNVCILPRYVDTGQTTSTGKSIYTIRPGVVVLPKYDKYSLEDGIHICISYPQGQPDDGVICGLYNADRPGTTIETYTASPDESYFKEVGNVTEEGYVLVCADNGIFDPSNYSNKTYNKSDYEDCFTWNGWKSKFVLLTPGSELKLRSCIQYDINCTNINTTNTGDNSTIDGNIFKQIRDTGGAVTGAIRKRIIGRQWVIENPEEIIPIPLHVNIDNDSSKNIHTFKQTLKGCQVYKTGYDPTTPTYKNKINCNLLGLASGKINYRRGAKDFDINIYNINNDKVKNNEYKEGQTSLPLVNATIYCKIIPKIHEYNPYMSYTGVKSFEVTNVPKVDRPLSEKFRYCAENYLGLANYDDSKYYVNDSSDTGVRRKTNFYYIDSAIGFTNSPFSKFLINPVCKYGDHYFMLKKDYPQNNSKLNETRSNTPGYGKRFDRYGDLYWDYDKQCWDYLGHTKSANILTNNSSSSDHSLQEKALREWLPKMISIDLPWDLSKWNNSNLGKSPYDPLYERSEGFTTPLRYIYYYKYFEGSHNDNFELYQTPPKFNGDYNNIKSIDDYNSSPDTGTWLKTKYNCGNSYLSINFPELRIDNNMQSETDTAIDTRNVGPNNGNKKSAIETWMSYCVRNNETHQFDYNWSEPKLIGIYNYKHSGVYGKTDSFTIWPTFNIKALRQRPADDMRKYGWIRWDEFVYEESDTIWTMYYNTAPGENKNKWGITPYDSTIAIDSKKFADWPWTYINNISDLDTFVDNNMVGRETYDTPIGLLLNRLKNEPYIEVYYTKILQYGFGYRSVKSNEGGYDLQSRFVIDGPHLLGEKETEEHSIFYNEEMGTKTNNSWYYYENPVILNLNISNSIDLYEDTGSNSVKNSVYMNQWGLYKASNTDTTEFSNIVRHLSY